MPLVPSSRWRVIDVLSTVRELGHSTSQKRVLEEQLKYFYKSALSEVVSLLNNSTDPSYFTGPTTTTLSTTLTSVTTNAVATIGTTTNFDRVVAIKHETLGDAVFINPLYFHSLGRSNFTHYSYSDDLAWTQYGNNLHFRGGLNAVTVHTISTVSIFYQRQPNYPEDWETDYVDLADRWVPLLIKRILTLVIMQNSPDIPRNLAEEMALDYQMIGAKSQSEIMNKLSKESTIKGAEK